MDIPIKVMTPKATSAHLRAVEKNTVARRMSSLTKVVYVLPLLLVKRSLTIG